MRANIGFMLRTCLRHLELHVRTGSWENQFGQFGLLGGRPRKLLVGNYGAVTRQLRGSWLSL
jgi:hypothetical protein